MGTVLRVTVGVLLLIGTAACSAGEDSSAPTTSVAQAISTSSAVSTTEPDAAARYRADVDALAADALEGRDNGSAGSTKAQDHLVDQLRAFAEPLGGDFRHPFDRGTNVLAVIPGSELPDEYVVLGAHYDHLGRECPSDSPGDDICNGATDNAAGVASVLEIGRRLAEGDAPRRSVVLAFWDAEEDGLVGSSAYVNDPGVPIESTVAYLNWDIQGSNLLPSLTTTTIVVGAETGGQPLIAAAGAATETSGLDEVQLSLLFGQGRSDHAVFANADVPVVLFTDSTSPCYHTAQDDTSNTDFSKLGQQIATGEALARDLATTDEVPTFDSGAPAASFEDARSMLTVVERARPDFGRFSAKDRAFANRFASDLRAIVDAGPGAFDSEDVGVLLSGSSTIVQLLAQGDCDGFVG